MTFFHLSHFFVGGKKQVTFSSVKLNSSTTNSKALKILVYFKIISSSTRLSIVFLIGFKVLEIFMAKNF